MLDAQNRQNLLSIETPWTCDHVRKSINNLSPHLPSVPPQRLSSSPVVIKFKQHSARTRTDNHHYLSITLTKLHPATPTLITLTIRVPSSTLALSCDGPTVGGWCGYIHCALPSGRGHGCGVTISSPLR